MPLTTLSSHIDYAFLTMPLDNSVVSIKVWLFRNFLDRDISLGSFSFFKLIRIPYKIFLEYRMKALLKKYKTFLIDKRKTWKLRKIWFRRRKRKRKKLFFFSFYKASNEVDYFSKFKIKNLDLRYSGIVRKFNTFLFYRNFYFLKNKNFYKPFLFIKRYFSRFNYRRFNFKRFIRYDNSLNFFDNFDNLHDFSENFNLSFLDRTLKRKKEIIMKSLNPVLFSNFFLESGKLESSFFFFFSNLKLKKKNYLNFFFSNFNKFFKNSFLLKNCFFSYDKFKRNFGFYNNYK